MPEEKRKGPPILSNPRYKSEEKECEGDCKKCMFSDRCNRRRKAEPSTAVVPTAQAPPAAPPAP